MKLVSLLVIKKPENKFHPLFLPAVVILRKVGYLIIYTNYLTV